MRHNRLATLYLLAAGLAVITSAVLGLWKPLLVSGSSMEPSLQHNDVVIAVTVPAQTLVPGDIAAVEDPAGRLIIHRILDVGAGEGDEAVLWMMGDNNTSADTPVTADTAHLQVLSMRGHITIMLLVFALLPTLLRQHPTPRVTASAAPRR